MRLQTERGCETAKKPFVFVHHWIDQQVRRHPRRAALVDEAGVTTDYAALAERTHGLAARLRDAGVGVDDLVAVCVDGNHEAIVSMLAAFRSGAAYVPLNPYQPTKRLNALLEGLQPAAVIATRDVSPPCAALIIDPLADAAIETQSAGEQLDPRHVAYVVHTSGSTGAPKGVAMSHAALARLVRWQMEDGPPTLSTLQFTSPGFDVAFQEVLSTLCTGGTLHLISNATRRDPERLLRLLCDRSIQRLFLPYVVLQQLANASRKLGIVPTALRHVITAGEQLIATESISAFFASLPGCRLDNHYGPSETHLVTAHTLPSDVSTWPELPPIGKPTEGVALYCLAADLTPVRPGEVGELFVGGSGVARGYVKAPARTAERFLPDPFEIGNGARMYRTGDLARVDGEGRFHFVGRTDAQIKVRGFRVEPAEVEQALLSHPDVREAVVVQRAIADEVRGLVAFVVAGGSRVSATALSRHLRELLPDYMVPSRIEFVDSLPLLPSGKADRRALSEAELRCGATDVTADEPLAGAVKRIWARVLGHDELEPDDDFFEVGGDSLLAVWVVDEIGRVLGRSIELSVFLANSTIQGIADALAAEACRPRPTRVGSEFVTLRAGPSRRPLFFLHTLGGEVMAYREIAQAIGSPLRVLGLRWSSGGPDDAFNLAEMAAAHVAQIRAIQPKGRYLLAGWSFGGILAYEIARQLMEEGEQIGFLGLLDAHPTRDAVSGQPILGTRYVDVITAALDEVDATSASGDPPEVSRLFADPLWASLLGHAPPHALGTMALAKHLRLAQRTMRAAMDHRFQPCAAPIHLFQAAATSAAIRESLAADLCRLALGTVQVHVVPGDHAGILRAQGAAQVARELDSALELIGD